MRLLWATARNYRIHRECTVRFDREVTLLVGPNEVGKSTFLEAVHRGLLMAYRRGGQDLAAMTSDHGGVPEVEVQFLAEGAEWHVKKVFRGPSGSLCQLRNLTTGKAWDKDEAEAELMRLMGREEAPRSEKELGATWSHLWAWQGRGVEDVFAVPDDAAELDRALAKRDAGERTGGLLTELEMRLLAEAEQAVAANWPPKDRKKFKADGEAARKQGVASELRQRLDAANRRFLERADQREQLAMLRERRSANRVELEAAEIEVAEVAKRIADRERRLDGVAGLRDKRRDAVRLQSSLAQEQNDRDAAASALQLAEQALAQADAEHSRRSAGLQQALRDAAAAATAATQAEAAREAAGRKQAAVAKRRLLREAEAREAVLLQSAGAYEAAKAAHDAAVVEAKAAIEVSPSRLAELRKMESAVARLETQLDAAAARIVHLEGPGSLRIDGQPLAPGAQQRIDRATRIEHADGTVLEVHPGGTDVTDLRRHLHEARAKLGDALLVLGVADMAAAADLEERWRSLQRQVELADAALRAHQDPTKDLVGLRAQIGKLRERAAADPELAEEDTEEQVAEAFVRVDADQRAARAAADAASAAVDVARERVDGARDHFEARKRDVDQYRGKLEESRRRFGLDETLAAAKVEAGLAVQRLDGQLAELASEESQLQDERVVLAANTRGRDGLRTEAVQLERDIARLEGSLQGDDEDTAATVERLTAEHERATADAAAATLRAEADKLLLETLEAIKAELRARREAPYLDACAKYLGLAFGGGSRLHLDESKKEKGRIGSVDRSTAGLAAHSFDVLSCGGKELVALAARLAMAEVLAAEHADRCVPVVLDDSLTNVDPARAKRVGGMLAAAAAAGVQVIVASCDDQRIGQWLAGAVVHLARG